MADDAKWLPRTPVAPFLRWAGSKRQLVRELSRYWRPEFGRYIEPFAGSACLFFAVCPPRALLGDTNRELIRTFHEVKYRPVTVARLLAPLQRSKRTFLEMRNASEDDLSPSERAARFIYLNRFCFNGLYRTNRDGKFNVPYGASRTGSLPSLERLLQCSRILKAARLRCVDFEFLVKAAEPGDFVYLDPPFSVCERRVFKEYQAQVFSRSDVSRLREAVEFLSHRGAHFVLSYVDSAEAEFLQRGFLVRRARVRRNIAGFAGKREIADELLISNLLPSGEIKHGGQKGRFRFPSNRP